MSEFGDWLAQERAEGLIDIKFAINRSAESPSRVLEQLDDAAALLRCGVGGEILIQTSQISDDDKKILDAEFEKLF